ncbi:MAG: hypothetical protein QOI14_755, partial [Actinomycetota bacterium]|nr:hypothetical protein [Actinomycetota bacterium]
KQSVVSRAVYCYAGSDTNSKHSQGENSSFDALSNEASSPNVRAKAVALAVESCAAIWTTGLLGSTTTAPPLRACVRNDQVIAVFPKNDATAAGEFCDNLGMSAP